MRFLLYSHDGLGLGHIRRNFALAAAITRADRDASVILATGADGAERLGSARNVEILKLPGIRKLGNGRYAARHLPISPRHVTDLRSSLLEATVDSFAPNVLVVDRHACGVMDELRPALGRLHEHGGRAVLGLRDILDDPETIASEWQDARSSARIVEYFDRVLVYGDRAVLDPIEEYRFPPEVARLTRFCGYVVNPLVRNGSPGSSLRQGDLKRQRPFVLATAGGGEDGFELLETFIDAAANAPWDGMVVAGSNAPAGQTRRLRSLAERAGVAFRDFAPELPEWLHEVDALVCMGGYNTLVEAVVVGTPTVCVPRVRPRSEQLIRARAFERLGLVSVIHPDFLDTAGLRRELARSMTVSRDDLARRAHAVLPFDGARRAGQELFALAWSDRQRRKERARTLRPAAVAAAAV